MTHRSARRFLELALRRSARGSGSLKDFQNRRSSVQPIPDIASILGELLWALAGAIALRSYAPERMTLDVDVLIHCRDEWSARQRFLEAGYEIAGELAIGGFSARQASPGTEEGEHLPVDVIAREDPWLEEALANLYHDEDGRPVLARPYLALQKLQAGRTQDLADVQRLLAGTPPAERERTRQLVGRYAPELVEDYDSLVQLADLEFGPPPEG